MIRSYSAKCQPFFRFHFLNTIKYKSNPKTSKMIAPQKPPGGDQVVEFFWLKHLYITNSPIVGSRSRRHDLPSFLQVPGSDAAPSPLEHVDTRHTHGGFGHGAARWVGDATARSLQGDLEPRHDKKQTQGVLHAGDRNICQAISVCSCGDFAPNQPTKSGIVVITNQLSLTYPYLEHHHRVLHVLPIKL